jgi:hypothetical protein
MPRLEDSLPPSGGICLSPGHTRRGCRSRARAWYDAYGGKPTVVGSSIGDVNADQVTLPGRLEDWVPLSVARAFIRLNQRYTQPLPNGQEWLEFTPTDQTGSGGRSVWEHTSWINPAALTRAFGAALDTRSLVRVDPADSPDDLKREIMLQEGSFVMLIERDGTLRGVVERSAMTDEAVRLTLARN